MESIRKWFYRPKKDDKSLLAQFFYADEALNIIANDLDSFDGRKDPERCTSLVNQLRQSQDKVLTITNAIMDDLIGDERANRDFRVKFPEDVLQENLAGQLWFGAECLAAGSSIMNREAESIAMRPLARTVTKSLEHVRNLLRDACLRNNTPNGPLKLDNNELVNEMLVESLKIFDKFFAEFELEYVSAMVPVKSTQEYELQEQIGVLFSETLQRALRMKLLTQEMVDSCDPALMFTIPRLAIVSGLLFFAAGPLYVDKPMEEMSEMFRPFRTLLHKIRELLWTLNKRELYMLEKLLCDNEDISDVKSVSDVTVASYLDAFIDQFYSDYSCCKDFTTASSFSAQNGWRETNRETCGARAGTEQKSINIPSTSTGYLISNSVAHDAILGTINDVSVLNRNNIESPPDQDSLEVISVAAATLSSILNNGHGAKTSEKDLESPNDSGVCTETTSLDRSPSLDLNETKQCACSDGTSSRAVNCNCINNHKKLNAQSLPANEKIHVIKSKSFVPGTGKTAGKRTLTSRKRTTMRRNDDVIDEDSSSVGSSDTSSFNSNCADDEEIALAMQAAEIATRNEIRSKYRSSEDLLHRLFVCIAGVADQLQTNFASDLRNILKAVFLINACDSSDVPSSTSETSSCLETSIEYHPTASEVVIENNEFSVDPNILAQEALFDTNVYFHLEESRDENNEYTNHPRQQQQPDDDNVNILSDDLYRYASIRDNFGASPVSQGDIMRSSLDLESPPKWIPDVEAPKCMSCKANFTVVKRRHHCRNCGKIFCARCSSNSVPLPKFGHVKPVRVCNKCFLYNLTPFTSLCD